MAEPTHTQIIRQLIVQNETTMNPFLRRTILEHFLKVRQATKERVVETISHPLINVTTYSQFDAEGVMICEDVVVEARHKFIREHI